MNDFQLNKNMSKTHMNMNFRTISDASNSFILKKPKTERQKKKEQQRLEMQKRKQKELDERNEE